MDDFGLLPTVFTVSVVAAVLLVQATGRKLRWPFVTIALALVTMVVGAITIYDDSVLDVVKRDGIRLVEGQWWRLFTPLVGQDGGLWGLLFDLAMLVAVGTAVENLFGRWMLLGVYVASGLVSEVAAYTLLPGQGFAGNSVANFGLAGLLVVTAAFSPIPARVVGLIGLGAGLILDVTLNLHGVGFTVGALVGLVVWAVKRRRTGGRHPVSRM
ncbi:MAG: rhomboid family intramembrane serine protease [Pseudolysinimonas sp.]